MERVRDLLRRLSDWILPPVCAACGAAGLDLPVSGWCCGCLDRVRLVGSPLCPLCGRPYPATEAMPDHRCGECLEGRFRFDRARSAAVYEEAVQKGILELKFHGSLHWAEALAALILRNPHTRDMLSAADFLVPVPLHPHRIRQRGFNQASVLAHRLARRTGHRVEKVLERRRKTMPQTRLSRRERLENVRGAFQVLNPHRVKGRKIVVIDDVFTTGTTLSECARALKTARAACVGVVTVARATPP
ncbi:comF family protein [Desulfacinum hydrothermale DSM 13146]|uniref:ComF family protein n=1 Tax=Desulfacinum hydrothermale DSM 13146 TaxID=1121390 RepID=A0A1W1XMG0_9BACT|nr:ComF family protein [Desulfacinum hydrothermale]SMC25169.1 comF family protein [Desulfacinum hydrothermale DSM 13146]